jgi:hypothetical protein
MLKKLSSSTTTRGITTCKFLFDWCPTMAC